MDEAYRELLTKQQYRLYKDHSAVKLCHWMKESLIHERHCYKEDFYGIDSHRCLQMTPAINQCSHMCTFCWRVQENDFEVDDWAEPKEMLDALIEHQRKLIWGFKGDPRCDPQMFEEARNPNQVAISLAGEPITYPYLSDFLKECHRRKMTTFMVTNGTYPEKLEALDVLPMQLYVTVAAPNKEVYRKVCRPKISDGWERIMRTLEMMPSLDTRTVIRHTLVKGINMGWTDEYAALDRIADPDLIEPKGYVFVGGSRQRLSMDCMPKISDGWERIMRTLEMMPSLDTRTVIRHTLVKGINMGWTDEYAALDRIADPDLIEPKGYVFVGGSRQRLSMDCMPKFDEIKAFANELGGKVGMELIKERADSRVVLLGHPGEETDVRKIYGWDNDTIGRNHD